MRFLSQLAASSAAAALVLVPAAIVGTTASPASARVDVGIGISVNLAPPPLPVYDQPPIPGPGWMWIPGYWAYGDVGYYWVPGYWSEPPMVGLYWTPAWWGWDDGVYLFHAGYWGPEVGWYGGIDYGWGYGGNGYQGGYWQGNRFFYNRAVTNIGGAAIATTFNRPVANRFNTIRTSYNGGPGGVRAQPTAQQLAADRARHVAPTAAQLQHVRMAGADRALAANVNHGKPPVAATFKPGQFRGATIAARAGGHVAPNPHPAQAMVTRTTANRSLAIAGQRPSMNGGRAAQAQNRFAERSAPVQAHAHAAAPMRGYAQQRSAPSYRGYQAPSRQAYAEHRASPSHAYSAPRSQSYAHYAPPRAARAYEPRSMPQTRAYGPPVGYRSAPPPRMEAPRMEAPRGPSGPRGGAPARQAPQERRPHEGGRG